MGFLIFIHIVVCMLLIIVILMQSGRGGGLTEAFASAESMFGAKTNAFIVRATAVFATLFIVTCLSLAFLSSKKDKSLMPTKIATPTQNMEIEIPIDMSTNSILDTTLESTRTQTP